jgi:hypothetical protein
MMMPDLITNLLKAVDALNSEFYDRLYTNYPSQAMDAECWASFSISVSSSDTVLKFMGIALWYSEDDTSELLDGDNEGDHEKFVALIRERVLHILVPVVESLK